MKRQWPGTDTIEFHILPQLPNGKGKHTIETAQNKKKQDRKAMGAALSQLIATGLS